MWSKKAHSVRGNIPSGCLRDKELLNQRNGRGRGRKGSRQTYILAQFKNYKKVTVRELSEWWGYWQIPRALEVNLRVSDTIHGTVRSL